MEYKVLQYSITSIWLYFGGSYTTLTKSRHAVETIQKHHPELVETFTHEAQDVKDKACWAEQNRGL